jgi:DedD protein
VKYTLKHRLIGAAFLVAIAVIFLPSFFKEKQVDKMSTKSQIPTRPGIVPVEFNAPHPVVDIEPAPAPETMFVPEDNAAVAQIPSSSVSTSASVNKITAVNKTTVVNKTLPANKISNPISLQSISISSPAAQKITAVSPMPLNAQGLPDAWVVQVGSFSTKEAANKLRDDLQQDGYKAYVRVVPIGGANISRVYIGPKLDKTQAFSIKMQIDKRLKVNSIVTHFQP